MIRNSRIEYQAVNHDYQVRVDEIVRIHKEHQLDDYLDGFSIADEMAKGRLKITGLSRGKLAALISHNIETFADVSKNDCLAVPGIGPAITRGLLTHRIRLSQGFKPLSQMSNAEKQDRMNLDMEFQARSSILKRRIESGAHEIAQLASRARLLTTQRNAQLELARQKLLNAAAAVNHLGGKANVPPLGSPINPFDNLPRSPIVSGPQLPITVPSIKSKRAQVVPSCPHCGSRMVKRTNRRRGNAFWGCSTFPTCRGTRNYP